MSIRLYRLSEFVKNIMPYVDENWIKDEQSQNFQNKKTKHTILHKYQNIN